MGPERTRLSGVYTKTETETETKSSLRNVVSFNIKRMVFYIKTGRRIMSRNIIFVKNMLLIH
jgi:hypothetical protein